MLALCPSWDCGYFLYRLLMHRYSQTSQTEFQCVQWITCRPLWGVLGAKSYMDPAERKQVLLVLVTEQFLDIRHVTEIGTGRLFWDHDVSQHKLIVRLRAKNIDTNKVLQSVAWLWYLVFMLTWVSPVAHRALRRFQSHGLCLSRPGWGNGTSAL